MPRATLFRWILPLFVISNMVLVAQVAVAQPTTTEDGACRLIPLELPLFGGTPVTQLASLSAVSTPAAELYTEALIRDVLDQYVVCTNTGDPTLVWAMFSPHWFSVEFADPQLHYLPAFEQMLTNPTIIIENPLELVSIESIVERPDGMVDVTASFRSGDREWRDTLTLVLVDGEWLIEDVRLDTSAN